MVPYIFLIFVVFFSTYIWGVEGFLGGIIAGYGLIAIIGWIIGLISGGMLPKKVRDETATDFIATYPEIVAEVFKNFTAYEAKIKIENLLDKMFVKANSDNSSVDVSRASTPSIFIPSAVSYSVNQSTEELKDLCFLIVGFICTHRLWFELMDTGYIVDELALDKKIDSALSKFGMKNSLQDEELNSNQTPISEIISKPSVQCLDEGDDIAPKIGQTQVLEGHKIARDCYENGLLEGNPVYLSQIEGFIRENFTYMPNAVLNGFLTTMTTWIESGEIVLLNIEGGDEVFVHKDYVNDLLNNES